MISRLTTQHRAQYAPVNIFLVRRIRVLKGGDLSEKKMRSGLFQDPEKGLENDSNTNSNGTETNQDGVLRASQTVKRVGGHAMHLMSG